MVRAVPSWLAIVVSLTAASAFAADAKPATPAAAAAPVAPAKPPVGHDDTPMQPNGKWHIHDGKRPRPTVITPGADVPAARPGKPPSDAIVLIGPGADLSKWQMKEGGGPVTWKMKGGVLETGKGGIRTADQFKDFQLHVEWASPSKVQGDSQGRGNSGIFLLGAFEVQVLDSFGNDTYADGQAAAMYGQYPPLVNACRKPGDWQAYDIIFTAPRFTAAGKLEKPAVVTVLHNGVVVHNANAYLGPTGWKQIGQYKPEHVEGPIALQDHGNPVRYRNMWLRPLKGYDEP